MKHTNAELSLFYIPCKDTAEAKGLAKKLLAEKLIACANINSPMTSIYNWEGSVCEEQETPLIVKALSKNCSEIQDMVQTEHGYDCPCILELRAQSVNSDYLGWVLKVTK